MISSPMLKATVLTRREQMAAYGDRRGLEFTKVRDEVVAELRAPLPDPGPGAGARALLELARKLPKPRPRRGRPTDVSAHVMDYLYDRRT